MKSNWFATWILAPLVAAPAIIVDPFTFYVCALGDDGPGAPAEEDDEATGRLEFSEE